MTGARAAVDGAMEGAAPCEAAPEVWHRVSTPASTIGPWLPAGALGTSLAEGLARVEGVADRDAAARLTGTRLYAERDRLPPPDEEEYYLADLIGLRAETEAGESLGAVRAVEDHGAGVFLVLEGPPERLVPFTRAVVPVVDLAGGRVVVVPPDEVVVPPGAEDAA